MIEAKKVILRKKNEKAPSDPLIRELHKVEVRLQRWLAKSTENAALFRNDPMAALRAAGVDLEDETMMELEIIFSNIARKLR